MSYLRIDPEVEAALADKKPVVALESTIIAHGLPRPDNLAVGRRLEAEIRAGGAVPATIAIFDGEVRVGLDEAGLERLATDPSVLKVSRRDLPVALARKAAGATTVSATMIAAEKAGIEVFVTGGIGGVHRGAAQTFDISADLQELARTSVAVVCAGAKSVLDLGLTLEYLETHGVPVLGLGTDVFPAFFLRRSPFPVDRRCDDVAEIAAVARAKWDFGLAGGVVVANPIPEGAALDPQRFDADLERALSEAARQDVQGKAVTPFLLQRLRELSGGDTLAANIELVLSNARVGAQLATCLAASRV